MERRDFLTALAAGAAVPFNSLADDRTEPKRFLISKQGCGRATAYYFSTKVLTVGNKTHVSWLDSVPDKGFRVRVRSLDRDLGDWSPVYTVGEARDNHGGPALTVDREGFLHMVYYPHHNPFRYRKSRRPNDASEWGEEIEFGNNLTYPTLVCGSDDTLYLTCREYRGRQTPWRLVLWTKKPGANWSGPQPLAVCRFTGYAAFSESLCFGPEHQVLHLCCRFHEKSDAEAYGRIQSVAYMRSEDFGKSWKRSDGTTLELPVTADKADALVRGGLDQNRVLDVGAIAVDGQGHPHVVYGVREGSKAETTLAIHRGGSGWSRTSLSMFLPEKLNRYAVAAPSGVVVTPKGRIVVTAHLQQAKDARDAWGHPSNEVVQFISQDRGQTFRFRQVSQPDPMRSHWLTNLERSSGHNQISERPGLIYTAGPAGAGLTDILANEVWWAEW